MKKKFPWLHKVKKADTSMFKMTYDLAGVQVGNLILNNVDSIIIMAFLGPVSVSIYTSYIFITRYLNEVSTKVELSVVNSFGDIFARDENEKVYPLFKELLVLFIVLSFSMGITFTLGIRGFINLWIGKENYLVSYFTVSLFTITSFLYIISLPLLSLINAHGYFKDNKNHIFICAIVNILLSLILVKFYSLNGLLIATATSFLLNIILKIKIVEQKIFNKIKHKNTIQYYTIIILLFIFLLVILKPLENAIFLAMTSLPTSVILLLILFVSLLSFFFGIFSVFSVSSRNLYERFKMLLIGKFLKKSK